MPTINSAHFPRERSTPERFVSTASVRQMHDISERRAVENTQHSTVEPVRSCKTVEAAVVAAAIVAAGAVRVYFRFSNERFLCAVAVVRRLVRPRALSSGGCCCWRARISLFELEKLNGRPDQTEDTRSPLSRTQNNFRICPVHLCSCSLRKSRRECLIGQVQTDNRENRYVNKLIGCPACDSVCVCVYVSVSVCVSSSHRNTVFYRVSQSHIHTYDESAIANLFIAYSVRAREFRVREIKLCWGWVWELRCCVLI